MMKRVDSAFRCSRVLAIWVPSIFDTNHTRGPPFEYGFRASVTIRGPCDSNQMKGELWKRTIFFFLKRAVTKSDSQGRIHRCQHWPHLWWPFPCSLSTLRCELSAEETVIPSLPLISEPVQSNPQATVLNHETQKPYIAVWFADLAYVTEAFHLLKNFVDIWHHILAIHHDGFIGAVPQGHMEHSATLRENTTSEVVIIQILHSMDLLMQLCQSSCLTLDCGHFRKFNTANSRNQLNNEHLSEVDLLSFEHLLPGSFNASWLRLRRTINK